MEKDGRKKRGICLELFMTFGKIGLFTFGGGYAMIPLIQREAGENKRWISEGELLDVVAIAESTPGPIAINAATFVGGKVAGVGGAACATLGMVLPSFLIILGVSYLLQAFRSVRAVRYAFWGIRAGVLALILKALWTLFRQCKKRWFEIAVMVLAFAAVALGRVSAISVILACGLLGVAHSRTGREKR